MTGSPRSRRCILAATGAVVVLASWARGAAPTASTTRSSAAGAGMVFFVGAENLMTLFLGLEWFSLCLYVLVAFDTDRETSLEASLKYLIVGGFGSAVLLFGSALVYGATGSRLRRSPRRRWRRRVPRRRARDDPRRPRVQGLGGAVPHVDAGRAAGRADLGDRVHVGGDEDRRAMTLRMLVTAFPTRARSGRSPSQSSRASPSPGGTSRRSRSAT